jgi:uncharacterized protein
MSTRWEDLLQSNLWWVSPTDIDKDRKIEEYNRAKIKWDPRIRKTFDYNEDIVYSLRGPRQVGKTTLIKLQISEFLHNEIPKWNILYYALDVENSPRDLIDIIKTYFTRTENVRDKEKRCYIFLDEISSIKNWQKGIKKLWDENYLKNCTLVVTGSHSVDVQHSTEKLPGRRGLTNDVYDKILLPMKFSEYVSLIDTDLRKIIEKHFTRESRQDIFLNILKNTIDVRFNELITYMPKLNGYLQQYLLTGGFPKVINEFLLKFKIEEYLYTDYFRSIIGEITSLDADEGTFKRLIKYIIEHHNYPLSYRNIQNGIDIGSSNTVERYVNLLLKMFVLTLFYRYDTVKKEKRTDKDKKIRFHDPFLFHVLNTWVRSDKSFQISNSYANDTEKAGLLVESIVGDHLIRLAFYLSKKKQMFDYSDYVYYWKDEKDYEVDYVLKDEDILLPIEVKYTSKNTKKEDLQGLFSFKRRSRVENALLLTKNDLTEGDGILRIPVSMFLLFI